MDLEENRVARSSILSDTLLLMRPRQWTKNLVVAAPFIFAFWDRLRTEPLSFSDLVTAVIPAAVLFCIISSGVYVFNDLMDAAADRLHPLKKNRPIASGRIPTRYGVALAVFLLGVGEIGACLLSASFGVIAAIYVAIQFVYTFRLKRVPLVDIIVIASGFVLRAISGAVVLENVTISPWLLLCTFLLAIFLALCKRRHERILLGDICADHRPGLEKYDRKLLDQLIAISGAATVVSYSIYTLWPQTVAKFGTNALGFTIPFVLFGIFRYLDLAYRHEKGGEPDKLLLTDVPLIINLILYGVTVLAVFLLRT